MRGVALCQLIPGATMVQIVTYIGYRVRGIWGALTATVAFVLPAFIALLILSAIYFRFHSLSFIQALFKGLGAIVVAIILNACITFGRPILKDWKVILIAVLSFVAFFLRWNFVLIFVLAALPAFSCALRYPSPKPPRPEEYPLQRPRKGNSLLLSSWLPLFAWYWCYLTSSIQILRPFLSASPRSGPWPSVAGSPPFPLSSTRW